MIFIKNCHQRFDDVHAYLKSHVILLHGSLSRAHTYTLSLPTPSSLSPLTHPPMDLENFQQLASFLVLILKFYALHVFHLKHHMNLYLQ